MVAGRKTQAPIVNKSVPSSPNLATGSSVRRNLGKSHLGGVIFGCKNNTIKECLSGQLFGLPMLHFSYVKNIDPGLPLFLFNYSDRKLHGIFEAASSGQMNINPCGWTTDGSERTKYPAQEKNEENPHPSSFVEEKKEGNPHSSSECQSTITQLIREVQELKAFNAGQTQKFAVLEQKLMVAEMEIQRLKDHCAILEPLSNPSVAFVNGTIIDGLDEVHLDPNESIFLIGGYDGESWLAAVNLYDPSQDVIKSLRPMNSVRSFSSAAQLKGELYVFGGGNGNVWYDTVESYSPANDQWTLHTPLNQEKGSLAGATIDNKIFAIGGGNGTKSFSDVEMLDLDVGRWISTRSMLQRRFALAAVELNGVLYATGGFDGKNYLESAERFDPREHSWTKIASMNTKRSSHSLVVFNEKLYALGGYDGTTMVPSIEIFDPRHGSWMCGEPMKNPRGYSAAGVIKDSIYVIGGIKGCGNVVETTG
ncbi:hypothetical protein I3760_09G216600 [Carya illinoinensis]|uniref:DCD domain-containing protein n=1 Tax=Carya illinoinensis TaxID=32201 RepID=A0A922J7N3_CARIL|nr:hypothetical protein I3760_09G216600 [Carya illinoinensis]KAG6697790.1 hypothetical protein I3842_09G219600 [Carya illinoinensis]KAG6697791.1 hypothetical protein I3842_09G219600 [Carya illinoinensis]